MSNSLLNYKMLIPNESLDWFLKTRTKLKFTIMRKTVLLFTLFLCGVSANAQKVFTVGSEQYADVKVFVVNSSQYADLLVYKLESEQYAGDNNGKWFFMKSSQYAQKTIFFLESAQYADLKIFFVDSEQYAGWKNKEKMHLLY